MKCSPITVHAAHIHKLCVLRQCFGHWSQRLATQSALHAHRQRIHELAYTTRCRRVWNHWRFCILIYCATLSGWIYNHSFTS